MKLIKLQVSSKIFEVIDRESAYEILKYQHKQQPLQNRKIRNQQKTKKRI
jgi:hypothetical protein